jgi:hypothetical protein
MKIIIFLIYLVSYIECIRVNDFCYKIDLKNKEQECQGEYMSSCGGVLCTKYLSSCQNLIIFYDLRNNILFRDKFKEFFSQIQDCPDSNDDVCFNTKDCIKPSFNRIWTFNLKRSECKCIGKHSYRCNRDYCGSDKLACDGLKRKSIKIKECVST